MICCVSFVLSVLSAGLSSGGDGGFAIDLGDRGNWAVLCFLGLVGLVSLEVLVNIH